MSLGLQDTASEARALGEQAAELVFGENRQINGATGPLSDRPHKTAKLSQVGIANNQDIDVTARSAASGHPGAVDNRHLNVWPVQAGRPTTTVA
jgi:hypothetical protein